MYYNRKKEHLKREVTMSQVVIALLIAAGLLAVIGIVALILFLFSKKAFYTALSFFVTDSGKAEEGDMKHEQVKKPKKEIQKSRSYSKGEVCKLVSKSDDRLRTIDNLGIEKITDAYYELVFMTRKNEQIIIACSETAYESIPFDKEGSLLYRRNTLIRFKYLEKKDEIIINN